MSKIPLFTGLVLLLLPLNWARLLILGEVPKGTDPGLVALIGLALLAVSLGFIWLGLPTLRHSYAEVPEVVDGGHGILHRLGAAIKHAREQAAQRRLDEQRRIEEDLERARTGTLAPIDPGAILLQKGELAFASIPASLLEMRTIGYRGRTSGVSVRVAKGVWLRQSGSRGTPEQGMVAVASGMLVSTNRRLIFAGDQKAVTLPFEKMSMFEPMRDGIRCTDARKTYNFLIQPSHQQQIFSLIAARLISERAGAA